MYAPIVLTTGYTTKDWQAASWSVFIRMFKPVDPGGDIYKGGLGIDEPSFIDHAYGVDFLAIPPLPHYEDQGWQVDAKENSRFMESDSFKSLGFCRW